MPPLSDDEMERWVAWKRATAAVMNAIAADIASASGLSSSDFSVLTRLTEQGGGRLRQQRLSDDLGWERSRLSRQLTRMEGRSLVTREGNLAERLITATPQGRDLVARARAAHAESVKRHLIDAVPAEEAASFWRSIGLLTSPAESREAGW